MFPARRAFLPLLLIAAASAAETGSGKSLPKENPFRSPTSGPAAAAPAEMIEFAGVSLVGKRTDLIIYDKTTKKSHWIAEGESKEGISVLRYDARRQQAVVKINGVEKVLPLRKGNGPVNAPGSVQSVPTGFNVAAAAPVPTVAVPPPTGVPPVSTPPPAAVPTTAPAAPKPDAPATPESQVKAETEARMLVSDLLEIGMAQRKAYEEAQRRAAEGNAAPAANSATTPATGTTPAPATQPEK